MHKVAIGIFHIFQIVLLHCFWNGQQYWRTVDLSFGINEVGQFLQSFGNENITIPTLNLDPDDTQRIEIGNDTDGSIIIGEAANITGTQGLKTISLKTFNDGDITLGTPGTSSLPDLQNISSITLIASQNGNITLGDLGTNTSINKISNISLTTRGLNLGSIKAKQIENLSVLEKNFQQSVLEILRQKDSKFYNKWRCKYFTWKILW